VKVLHVPFSFPPDPIGGTEVYVEALVRQQQFEGTESLVAAPGATEQEYSHRDIRVRRFQVAEQCTGLRELYDDGDVVAAEAFARILDSEKPDIVHLHAFTRGVSLRLVRETKRRGALVIFSYHTPTVSCQRGTLLRWGAEVCDGALDPKLCSPCALHALGLNRYLSQLVASLPSRTGRIVGSVGLSGGAWTAIRMTGLVALRQAIFRSLMTEVDHVVALCDWVKGVLVRNGVPAAKITVSRQGLCQSGPNSVRPSDRKYSAPGSPLRMMWLGRVDPTKGLHILLEVLRAAPEMAVELDIYGVVQSDAGAAYLKELQQIAGGDGRIRFLSSIAPEAVVSRMREYDVLAVPSQCLETGPMVVMEAFAAGLPVVGSNCGGIAELVTDGVDGLLVEPRSLDSWRRALEMLCEDRSLLTKLWDGIRAPRSIADVAGEMSALYARLLGPKNPNDLKAAPNRNAQPHRPVATSVAGA
jgi:glycosyltransferase involved in cell wall biosynthesis